MIYSKKEKQIPQQAPEFFNVKHIEQTETNKNYDEKSDGN